MKALILAAGFGNRLGALTEDCPKPLVPLNGRPLIGHVLAGLRHPSITEIAVVGGFQFDRLRACVAELSTAVQLFYNSRYALGSIESVFAAREFLTGDFLLCNADHLYRPAILERALTAGSGITAMCDFDRSLGPDDMKIRRRPDGHLATIHKELTAFDGGYIGMTC